MQRFKNYYVMKQHHLDRLKLHTDLVKKYLRKIIDKNIYFIDNDILKQEIKNHDLTKMIEPELTPYILISWFYKMQKDGNSFEMSETEKEETHQATVHHVLNNSHHPEFWSDDKVDLISRADRDGIQKLVDATKMPLENVCCMAADWLAMAEEKGTNVFDWANKTINKRWKFDDMQVSLILRLLGDLTT